MRLTSALFVSAILLLTTGSAHAVCGANEDPIQIPTESAKDCTQGNMRCAYWEPLNHDAAAKYPLVIFLHGAGGSGTDATLTHLTDWNCELQAVMEPGNRANFPAFVMSPRAPNYGTSFIEDPNSAAYVIWDWANPDSYDITTLAESSTLTTTRAMIQALQAKHPNIDADRIYVTGVSMGGYGTWDLISRNPQLFAAGVASDGGGSPQAAPGLRNMAVWSSHNLDDSVPINSDQAMFEAVAKAGGRPYFTEGVMGGHEGGMRRPAQMNFVPWMFAQRRLVPATPLSYLEFSPQGGQLPAGPVTISLNAAGADEVRYTTDGTMPSTASDVGTLYNGPFTLDTSAILIAAAHSGQGNDEVTVFHAEPFKLGDIPLPAGADLMPSPPGGTGGAPANGSGGTAAGGNSPTTLGGSNSGGMNPVASGGSGNVSSAMGGAGNQGPISAVGGGAPGTNLPPASPLGMSNAARGTTKSGCSISSREDSNPWLISGLALLFIGACASRRILR